ncbi:unnamed protein product [Ectocarpus sp. 12 AP-2014]
MLPASCKPLVTLEHTLQWAWDTGERCKGVQPNSGKLYTKQTGCYIPMWTKLPPSKKTDTHGLAQATFSCCHYAALSCRLLSNHPFGRCTILIARASKSVFPPLQPLSLSTQGQTSCFLLRSRPNTLREVRLAYNSCATPIPHCALDKPSAHINPRAPVRL